MPKWIIAAVVAAIALVVGVAIGVTVERDDTTSSSPSGSLRQVCADWMDDAERRGAMGAGMRADADEWCAEWASWADDQMHDDLVGTMGGMRAMWGDDAEAMRDACLVWAGGEGDDDAEAWCADMSRWMRTHLWMGTGSAGGPPTTGTTTTTSSATSSTTSPG